MSSSLSNPYGVKEEETAKLNCTVTDANPHTVFTWRRFKTDSSNTVYHSRPTCTFTALRKGKQGQTNAVGASEAITFVVMYNVRDFIYYCNYWGLLSQTFTKPFYAFDYNVSIKQNKLEGGQIKQFMHFNHLEFRNYMTYNAYINQLLVKCA